MWRPRKSPQFTSDQALAAKPVRLVRVDVIPTPDGGGTITAPLPQPTWGRWLFKPPPGAKKTYELDSVGVFVWQNIDGRTSVRQIIERLAKRYDLNLREAQVPTIQFLQMLLRKGLIGVSLEKS